MPRSPWCCATLQELLRKGSPLTCSLCSAPEMPHLLRQREGLSFFCLIKNLSDSVPWCRKMDSVFSVWWLLLLFSFLRVSFFPCVPLVSQFVPLQAMHKQGLLHLLLPFSHRFPLCISLGSHRNTLLVMCLHPGSGAGCSGTVAPFSAMPVQGACPSPRLRHVHVPAQGCPHLPCLSGALNNSSLPAVAPGLMCTCPATESTRIWQSFILPVMWHQPCPCELCSRRNAGFAGLEPPGRPRLPCPQTHRGHRV